MNELKKYVNNLLGFTESEMRKFTSLFSESHFKKNEYVAIEGEYSTKLVFIIKGVMRAFYRNSNGDEYNKTFFTEFNFVRSEEHTSELQSLMRISYAVFCLKKKNKINK